MLPNAKTAASTAAANKMSVEDYVADRIARASNMGYTSTHIWLKEINVAEATKLLQSGGYKYTVAQEEPGSKQLHVSWE